MRLILSRKGFDSSVGGVASPIFPDGRLLSLPIPLASAPIRYGDIAWDGTSLAPVVEALTRGRVRGGDPAHLDPDLNAAALPRLQSWGPAFGQVAAAQTHLAAQGVGPGDLFLFFGWFCRASGAPRGWRQCLRIQFELPVDPLRIGPTSDGDGHARDLWIAGSARCPAARRPRVGREHVRRAAAELRDHHAGRWLLPVYRPRHDPGRHRRQQAGAGPAQQRDRRRLRRAAERARLPLKATASR